MSQLQPVLESFNQTLKHLSSEVEALSQDLQQLRMEQEEHRPMTKGEGHSRPVKQRLEYSHLQISQMKTQLDAQKDQFERAFQVHQELLQHNLTKLREEMDDQIIKVRTHRSFIQLDKLEMITKKKLTHTKSA